MNTRTEKSMSDVVGKYFTNKYGDRVKVLSFNSAKDVVVIFDNGYSASYQKGNLVSGNFKSPYSKTVYGVAYSGEGCYKRYDSNGCITSEYSLWKNVLNRALNPKYSEIRPSYKHVELSDSWLNFQNFASWCNRQVGYKEKDESGRDFVLDKDLLGGHYIESSCYFVPLEVNNFLTKREASRGSLPIGVSLQSGRFKALNSVTKKFKYFSSGVEAFHYYKTNKESKAKELARKWKGKIDQKAYNALIEWAVGIND